MKNGVGEGKVGAKNGERINGIKITPFLEAEECSLGI